MDIKLIAEIFQELGAGNTALIVILFLFTWGFVRIIKVLPNLIERLVSAIENLGTTFAVHDVRASAISQTLLSIESNIKDLNRDVANQENITRIHERLDSHFVTAATKEDIKLILTAINDHSKNCQEMGVQLQRDVIGGRRHES